MSSPRRVLDAVEKNVAAGAALGMLLLQAEDERLDGRHLQIRGRRLLAFTSCSYLGLELDPRLIEASVDAVRRYGTQFSASRTYVSAPPYHCVDEKAQIQVPGALSTGPGTRSVRKLSCEKDLSVDSRTDMVHSNAREVRT